MRGCDPGATLPGRIWIVGAAASGKTTLALRLGEALQRPATLLDELHWLPNWQSRPDPELHARIEAVARKPQWIIEGNYGRFRARQRHRIGLLIWLDLPLPYVFVRLVRRCWRRSLRGETCCNGNRESLRRTLLHRDSILLYMLSTWSRHRREYRRDAASMPCIRLRSAREVDRFLQQVSVHAATRQAA
jgi:adenylate kinase family enzyme